MASNRKKLFKLQEHKPLKIDEKLVKYDEKYNRLELVNWDKPEGQPEWGYYAYYKIGAEWIDKENDEALVVTTKEGMENIDFLKMFMACFNSNLAVDSFSEIYKIKVEEPQIEAPMLASVLSLLIVTHFLGVVSRIKNLKKGYVNREENLKKVKGRIMLLRNERLNIATRRYDRIFCEYDEFSEDIPENRIIKKALVFSKAMFGRWGQDNASVPEIKRLIVKNLAKFNNVGDEVMIREVGQIRTHKLFKEYFEAVRLAKLILKRFDYDIHKTAGDSNMVTPFYIDMSLLYEHYVYGLLHKAYDNKIAYQFRGVNEFPDFLYVDNGFGKDDKTAVRAAILDAKYKPRYANDNPNCIINDIRQLSGYARDEEILKELGCENPNDDGYAYRVPCYIIYPTESQGVEEENPFINKRLEDFKDRIEGFSRFYKISVPLPRTS